MSAAPLQIECPLCGPGPGRPRLRSGPWQVAQCSRCGLCLTWPRPRADVLASLYAAGNYYAERDMGADAAQAWRERASAVLAVLPRPPRRVLDVGAGEGHMVAALRQLGYECDGVEPFQAGREAAHHRYGIELAADWVAGRYDLVTFIHSLEHVVDPLGYLRGAAGLLEPGGHVFVEVPHAGSIEMLRPSRRRMILDLPFHLYHFVPETLERLMSAAGFENAQLRLFNPEALERLLELRRWWNAGTAPGPLRGTSGALASGEQAGSARLWRQRLLRWLRERLPGWKFQLVAARPLAVDTR